MNLRKDHNRFPDVRTYTVLRTPKERTANASAEAANKTNNSFVPRLVRSARDTFAQRRSTRAPGHVLV